MSGDPTFVSVFKINGRPIIPPVMTPRRRTEMQEYKVKALAIEKRLEERKRKQKGEQRNLTYVHVDLDEDGNKENYEIRMSNESECSVFGERPLTKSIFLENECLIPQFLHKSVEGNPPTLCNQHCDECLEEAHSVAPTESTDLHPYLNTSFEDEICSSEVDSSVGCNTVGNCNCVGALMKDVSKCALCEECTDLPVSSFPDVEMQVSVNDYSSPVHSKTYNIACEDKKEKSEFQDKFISGKRSVFSDNEMKSEELFVGGVNRYPLSLPSAYSAATSATANDYQEGDAVRGSQGILGSAWEGSEDSVQTHHFESPPAPLIRKGSFILDAPSPFLIANIEKFTVDTVSQGDHCFSAGFENKTVEIKTNECSNFKNLEVDSISAENCKLMETSSTTSSLKGNRSRGTLMSKETTGFIEKTSDPLVGQSRREPLKSTIRSGSVFERLAADAARKAEERRKLTRKHSSEMFKVPKKVVKKTRLWPSVSASNLRTSLSAAYRKKSNVLLNRRFNSELNVSSTSGNHTSATSSSLKQNTVTQVEQAPIASCTAAINERRLSKERELDPSNEGVATESVELQDLNEKGSDSAINSAEAATGIAIAHSSGAPGPEKSVYWVQTSPISPPLPQSPTTTPTIDYHPISSTIDAGKTSSSADGDTAALQRGRQRKRWSEGWTGWTSAPEASRVDPQPDNVDSPGEMDEPKETSPVVTHHFSTPKEEHIGGNASQPESVVSRGEIDEPKETSPVVTHHFSTPKEEHIGDNASQPESVVSRGEIDEPKETSPVVTHHFSTPKEKHIGDNASQPESVVSRGEIDEPKETSPVVTHHFSTPKEKHIGDNASQPESVVSRGEIDESKETSHVVVCHFSMPKEEHIEDKGYDVKTPSDKNITAGDQLSVGEVSFHTMKIPPSLEKTIDSMPASPLGTVSIKETALKLLGCLVEEQDKAMARLLEDQRLQAEKMKERFKMQQKCLVERVAQLVGSLSTPPVRKSKTSLLQPLSDGNSTISSKQTAFESPTNGALGHEGHLPQALTPVCGNSRDEIKGSDNLTDSPSSSSCSSVSQLEFLSQLRTDDELEEKSSKNMVDESESDLIKFSNNESLPLVENDFCQVCLSLPSNCRCPQEGSSCSSTVREEITTITVDFQENVECDVGYNSSGDKTICPESSTQDTDCNVVQSSVSPNEYVPQVSSPNLNIPPTVKKDNLAQEGLILDLSEILEMELGQGSSNLAADPIVCMDNIDSNSQEVQGTTGVSTVNLVNAVDGTNFVNAADNLLLYRQMYEQDVQRLAFLLSSARKQKHSSEPPFPYGNEAVISSKRVSENSGSCELTPTKLSEQNIKVNEQNEKKSQSDLLPDLSSASEVLQVYLGPRTPSMGPVFLETPISSVGHQRQVMPACSTPTDLPENNILRSTQSKENISFVNNSHSPSTISPVVGVNLECKENLDLSPNELHLSIRSSSSGSSSCPDRVLQSTSEKYVASDNSCSSGQYTTASSKCYGEDFSRLNKDLLLKFSKLNAFVKGYLTRRLLKTATVHKIKVTIRDLLLTALEFHSEVAQEENVNPTDVRLHGQILTKLNATCEEFHHVFFGMTSAQKMAIIAADRQRMKSSSVALDTEEVTTPRPALLSAVTLKTLQRRFNTNDPSNKCESNAKSKCDNNQLALAKKASALPMAEANMNKNVGKRDISSVKQTSRAQAVSENHGLYLNCRSGKLCHTVLSYQGSEKVTSKVQTQVIRRKPRRSVSAGEINRRPWR